MSIEIFSVPDHLIDKGFIRKDDDASDRSRWVYFKKEIPIGNTEYYLRIVVTYDLVIYDDPNASYEDNHNYSFERIECIRRKSDNEEVFKIRPHIESLDDVGKLEQIFN